MFPSSRNSNLVLVQKKVKVKGQWNDTVSWVEHLQVWVSINPNRGRESFKGDEKMSVVSHTIRADLRELETITDEMRIVYNDKHEYDPTIDPESLVFDVLSIMPDYDMNADMMVQVALEPLRYGKISEDIPR